MPTEPTFRSASSDQTIALVEELELNRPADIRHARDSGTVRVKARATIRPANVAMRASRAVEGTTGELQRHGVSCLLPEPLLVGDVFHVSFDRKALDVAAVLSVCDRCIMLSETAFESHFHFLQEITVPNDIGSTAD